MKKLTIRWKIMLWYTLLLAALLGIIMPFLYYTLSLHLHTDAKAILQAESDRAIESMEFEQDSIQLDSDVDTIRSGIYFAVFSNRNQFLSGKRSPDLSLETSPRYGEMYLVRDGAHVWLVSDRRLMQQNHAVGWLRTIKSLDAIENTLQRLRAIILTTLPLYLILALFGGSWISKKALRPIVRITDTAKQIGQQDLTQRIRLSGPSDEVGILAETFDEMLDRLEASFDREKRFSGDVAHELRTPTTAIMLCAEEALRSKDNSNAEYRASLESILKESKRMHTMISQLLMLAKGTESGYQCQMERIDISMLTEMITDELSAAAQESGISLSHNIQPGILLLVEQTLYMRLLMNLLQNAIKYNRPQGTVSVSLRKAEDVVVLCVQDSGIGISPENLPHIWDRFFQADAARSNASPGLGLSIVKWIAELHGASLHVESTPGEGSRFEIRFPIQAHEAAEKTEPTVFA